MKGVSRWGDTCIIIYHREGGMEKKEKEIEHLDRKSHSSAHVKHTHEHTAHLHVPVLVVGGLVLQWPEDTKHST